jgi:hypothetical protein
VKVSLPCDLADDGKSGCKKKKKVVEKVKWKSACNAECLQNQLFQSTVFPPITLT